MTTQERKDRAADLRYQKAYGMTLEEVITLSKSQNDACAICGRPFADKRGCVDHAHRIAKAKIEVVQEGKEFYRATSQYGVANGMTKKEATDALREYLKRKSVRGMLCFICNRMVLGRMDRVAAMTQKTYPVTLENLRNYLMAGDPTNPLLTEN